MPVTVKKGGGRGASTGGGAVEKPSEQIVNAANALAIVTTSSGKQLGIRKLTSFNEMLITKAVGREHSGNEQYMLWCMIAATISSVDGDKLPLPQTALECEAVIQRIGDEGVTAIQLHAARMASDKRKNSKTEDMRDAVGE